MDPRIQKMAEVLINYSTAVQPGDRVLLRGTSPAAEPLIQALLQETLKVGGHPFPYLQLRNGDALALEATDRPELLSVVNPMLELMYQTCEVVIRVEASENIKALSGYPQDLQRARAKGWSDLIQIQMAREGNGSLRRCTTLFPTQAYAQTAGMSLSQYETFVFQACQVHLADPVAAWDAMAAKHQILVDYLRGKQHLHIQGVNIDLQMSIADRTFIGASGKANFPDGEIFTGPVEESVNGWVKFTYPAYFGGNEVVGAALTFEDGRVVKAEAERNEDFLLAALDTDAGSRYLGEFAIGTNEHIQQFTGSILFDEKIGGTVHMALGQGYPKTGSHNISALHWDMICDMRTGGEILVDGESFYRDGVFLVD